MPFFLRTLTYIFFIKSALNGQGTITKPFEEIRFSRIEDLLNSGDSTVWVLNFWATWCKPCVAELPYFQNIKAPNVRVVLISLDFPKEIETRLATFVEARNIKETIWWLNEAQEHLWIPKIHTNWTGAIPATLIIQPSSGLSFFKEGAWSGREELLEQIATLQER
jgi:thiol-disulfide isomerase/thioredoxin